jgi:template-activating factor I
MASKSAPPSKKQKKEEPIDEEKMSKLFIKLEEVEDKIDKLNEECSEEVLQVERKYNEKRNPFYKERSQIIRSIPYFWKDAVSSFLQVA